jgi:hypothetical protein
MVPAMSKNCKTANGELRGNRVIVNAAVDCGLDF